MAHCAKYTKGAMGHLMKHYERSKDENGEYIKFGNESIDTSRSHLNYNLAPHQNQLDFIHKRLSEVYCLKRKDVNVMCSWVVTAPKELPTEHTKEFFEYTYSFLEKKYGKENVISAYVHMDETTPHMHFAFVPVVFDIKKDKLKVSAKEKINRHDLQTFHNDLQRHLEASLGYEVNILNEATKNGNRSIEELKRGSAIQQVQEIQETLQNAQRESFLLSFDNHLALTQKNALKDEIERLNQQKQDILKRTEEEVEERLQKADNVILRAKELYQKAKDQEETILATAREKAEGIEKVSKFKATELLQQAKKEAETIKRTAIPLQVRKLQEENWTLKQQLRVWKEQAEESEELYNFTTKVLESDLELLAHYQYIQKRFQTIKEKNR